MTEWQKRVVEEHDQMVDKIIKLGEFMCSDTYRALSGPDQDLLFRQDIYMRAYANVLSIRIRRFSHESIPRAIGGSGEPEV